MIGKKVKYLLGLTLIAAIFILITFIVQNNVELIQGLIQNDFLGILVYISVLIVSAVVAPIDVLFLMPIATALWGWIPAALISLFGWTLGSAVVFALSRKYGVNLIKRLVPLKKIYEYEKLMPKRNVFFSIVFLRIAVPVDIVSYAIGLFTRVNFSTFFFATLLGFTPLAFALAYLGSLPANFQLISFILFAFIVVLGILYIKRYNKTRF